jgi:hypothetical protein
MFIICYVHTNLKFCHFSRHIIIKVSHNISYKYMPPFCLSDILSHSYKGCCFLGKVFFLHEN